jgi:two-component system, sensor histidine kinase and response regulator
MPFDLPTVTARVPDKVNILMVDDSPDKLLAMESVLASLGQNLVKVKSGEEALRILLKQEFALILLDVNMPGLDGFETAQLIRKRKSLELIPIIFVTALSTTDAEVFKGYEFGAVDYILTPIVPEILRTKVGVFVELWKHRYELQARAEALRVANTVLEERAQQLIQANRELETFCYTIAHDLRAPLRAMEGLTALLLDDCGEKLAPNSREYGERIRDAAGRMDQMIKELLSYSRLTLMAMKAQPVRMARVVKDGLAQLTWEIEQCKATVNVTESNHMVLGNYAILVQVIVNLVANALKFVDPSKTADVTIYDEEREDFLRVWVVDNGIGIAAEHQDRIFRIFERLHGRDSFTGTGIGLAIVHKAISRLNGRVGVESEVGKGSRFWFELPIHRPSDGEESLVESGELEAV